MEASQQTQRTGSSRKRWYTNAYVLIIIFISAAAMGITGLLFGLLPSSSEVIPVMQWRMVRTKSFYAEMDLTWDGTIEKKDRDGYGKRVDEEFALSSRGWFDKNDEKRQMLQQSFGLRTGSGKATTWGGEYRRIGEADYVNFEELPGKIGALDVAPFRGRWLRFDSGRLRRSIDAPIFGGGVAFKELDKQLLIEELRRTPFFRFEGRLKNDTLGGVVTYHYVVMPEVLFFKDYFIRFEATRLGRELNKKERQAMDTFFANVTPEQGELWIGRGDYYLYRMRLRFRYDDGERKGVFSFTSDLGRFNQPSGVTAPEGETEDITAILASLLPGIAAHLPLAKDGKVQTTKPGEHEGGLPVSGGTIGERDTDEDGLADGLERFYGTDPGNPDTDGDGDKDGEEISKGTNPVGSGALFDFGITESLNKQ